MTQAPPSRPERPEQPARPGRSWRAGLVPLRTALGLFTILPVRAAPEIGRDDAARAVLWLPVVGLLLCVPAAAVLLAVEAGGHSGPRRLLAAALAIGVLALLTGGLHLDGLADTADGLGSRRPRDEALAIMRRSDVGPFGVAAHPAAGDRGQQRDRFRRGTGHGLRAAIPRRAWAIERPHRRG